MRSLTTFFVLLVVSMAPGSLANAQGTEPASKTDGSGSATKAEVSQLRSEVAAQRQTIEELKALVEKLVDGKLRASDAGSAQVRPVADTPSVDASALTAADGAPHLMNTVLVQPDPVIDMAMVDQPQSSRGSEERHSAHGRMERGALLYSEPRRTVHDQPLRLREHRLPRL